MKKLVTLILCLALIFCSTVTSSAESTKKISIGSGSAGGGFYMGANSVANVVNTYVDGYEMTVEVVGASANNAMLVQAGEIDLGMCATETAWEAYNGMYDFNGDAQCDKIRAVLPGWGGVYMFVTTVENNINSLYDLEGKSFSSGSVGSATEVFASRVYEVLGIHPNSMHLPVSEGSRGLSDGTIAGYMQAHPAPGVTELEVTNNIKLLVVGEEYKDKFAATYPQYVWLTIPGGYYKALPEDTYGAGLYNMVISSVDFEEEAVYKIVKACYEHMDFIATIYPQFAEGMVLDNIGYSTIPYHAGAIRYFRERGIKVPEELIPAEVK